MRALAVAVMSSILFFGVVETVPAQNDSALQSYQYAARLFESGFHDRAIRENEAFLSNYPRHEKAPMARWRLAQSLYELGRYEESRGHLDQLHERGSDFEYHLEVSFRRAQSALQLGKHKEGARLFGPLATAKKKHYLRAAASFFEGECLFRVEDYDGAEEAYRRALSDDEEGQYARPAHYGLGWSLYRAQNWDVAQQELERFLSVHPQDPSIPEITYLAGECARKRGDFETALRHYDRIGEGDYAEEAALAGGFAASEAGDHENAVRRFAGFLNRFDKSPLASEAQLQYGVELYRIEAYPRSRDHLKSILQDANLPRADEAWYWLGLAHSKLGETEPALQAFEKALGGTQDAAQKDQIQVAKGDTLFDAGRFDAAATAYESVQIEDPYAARAKALALLNASQFEAAANLSRALLAEELEESQAEEVRLVLAESLFGLGLYDQAEAEFATVLGTTASSERSARGWSRVGWCRFFTERGQAAYEAFATVCDKHAQSPLAPEASLMAGRSLMMAGEDEAASKWLNGHCKSHHQTPFGDDGFYYLGHVDARQRRYDEAAKSFETVLKDYPQSDLADRAMFELATAHDAREDKKSAAECFERVCAQWPQSPLAGQAAYQGAWCRFELEEFDVATERALSLGAKGEASELSASSLELAVEAARKAAKPQQAARCYALFAQKFPGDGRAADIGLRAALSYRDIGNLEEAEKLLDLLVRSHPQTEATPRLYLELAFVKIDLENVNQGGAALEELERRFPNHALSKEAAFQLGELAYAEENWERARDAYARATQRCQDLDLLARSYYKLGWSHLNLNEHREASRAFFKLPSECPESPLRGEATFLAGEALYQGEAFAEAIPFYRTVREEFPEHEVTDRNTLHLAVCLGETEQWEECRSLLERFRKETPDFEEGAERDLWLGRSLLALGERRTARQILSHVIDSDRSDLAARARLETGRSFLSEDLAEQALAEFLKVALLSTDANDIAEGLYLSGICLERTGEVKMAIKQYREVIDRYPTTAFARTSQERLDTLQVSSQGGD